MRTKHWALTTVLVLGALTGPAAQAEDGPLRPPSITYPGSRESKAWVETPGGTNVAVDDGVAWRGVKVYLSLTFDLVGVDAETGKTLYATSVGAYWNTVTFKEVEPAGGAKQWAVELSSRSPTRRSADRRQYHDLRTGKKLKVPGLEHAPSGAPFAPRANWHGDKSDVPEPFTVVVSTEKNWVTLQERMFGAVDPERFGPVDFERDVVLATSWGNSWNCTAIDFGAGFEDAERILLRTKRHTFQTIGGAKKTRPWGLFVLPRREKKAYVVERNAQNLIGGPPIWTRLFKLERLGPPEAELAKLPARSDTQHHGWEGEDDEPPPLPVPQPPDRDR